LLGCSEPDTDADLTGFARALRGIFNNRTVNNKRVPRTIDLLRKNDSRNELQGSQLEMMDVFFASIDFELIAVLLLASESV
jgi:hypothetical protein